MRRLVRTGGIADEIVQEAFLRTYTSDAGAGAEPLRPYLFSVARNLAFNVRRHEKVVAASAAASLEGMTSSGNDPTPEEVLLADERIRLLNEAVGSLPPQCRAVFTLRMFQDRSYKEIAAQLGISTRTVEKHIAFGVGEVHAVLRRKYTQGERQ